MTDETQERELGALDRALRIFGDVRAGEGATVVLMCVNVALLLIGYYILKTAREPLILMAGGAELKSYAAAAQAAILVGYVPLYGWLAQQLPRQKFLAVVILFFIACIQLFFLGGWMGMPHIGFVFFVWVGIFSLTTIAQFWSYANELYSREDGSRLFPLIAVGSAAGAPVGAALAAYLFSLGLSPFVLMQVAAGLLFLHLVFYRIINRRTDAGATRPSQEPMKGGNGFALVFKSRYLSLIALLLVLLNIVNTIGEYILGQAVVTTARSRLAADAAFNQEAYIGSFYGQYFFLTNVATILLQAFLVSRIVKRFGMAGVLLALPVVALGAYGVAASGAALAVLLWVKVAENSTDYSVMNTGKQMVWLPTTREEKYKAKQAIDTFFVRSGDMLAAGAVFAGTNLLHFGVAGFARTNIAVVLMAVGAAVLLLREYGRLAPGPAPGGAER